MNPIQNLPAISQPAMLAPLSQANQPAQAGGSRFQELLLQSLQGVSGLQESAESSIQQSLLQNDITNVEVLTTVKKADLALRMMLQVRNKVLEAYNEVKQMRM